MSFTRSKEDKEKDFVPPTGSKPSPIATAGGATTGRPEAYLGQGSRVTGTLVFTGQVELDGYVEGELQSQDRLIVGESAVINARIAGSDVLVKGTVTGDISASKRLVLKKPAKVVGNISSTCISIEEGVVFEGQCTMNNAATTTKSGPTSIARVGSAS
jgi:cytoskeletal protein CcmA (bactofilin family)